jgi:peptidoglycan hydrolase CwlO-like protein
MLKNIFFILMLSLAFTAQAQIDTSSYQNQRLKINSLLQERSARFGQYEQSLNERTGIFGFQTKQDIKNSNEILRQITLNDNNIFKEIKVLLDYKDLQVQQIQRTAQSNTERIQSYMAAIKKLQDQNEILRNQIREQETESGNSSFYVIIAMAVLLLAAAYLIYTKTVKIKNSGRL